MRGDHAADKDGRVPRFKVRATDLLDLADSATAGLIWGKDRAESAAYEVRRRLAAAVGARRAKPDGSNLDRARERVLAEVNEATMWVVDRACVAVDRLACSGCRFRLVLVDAKGRESVASFDVNDVAPFGEASKVLMFSKALSQLGHSDQASVMRLFDHIGKLTAAEASQAAMRIAKESTVQIDRDVANLAWAVERATADLSQAALNLVQSHENQCPDLTWSTWALPVQLHRSSSDEQVLEAANWLGRIANMMYRPLPLDSETHPDAAAALETAWAAYEDAGDAFAVLAAWLRCLIGASPGMRCDLCYRHLGKNMKRYCRCHRRTSAKRQTALAIHVGALYRGSVTDNLRAVTALDCWRSRSEPNDSVLQLLSQFAEESGLHPDLVRPASVLAAMLRSVWPVMHSEVASLIQDHFSRVLKIAQMPFDCHEPTSYVVGLQQARDRHEAKRWLNWQTFFQSWFGEPAAPSFAEERLVGGGLDVDHPLCEGTSVSQSSIAVDLIHFRVWSSVYRLFSMNAYLLPEQVQRLRSEGKGNDGAPMTLRQIGEVLGVSAESARKALEYVNASGLTRRRRGRLLPQARNRLRQLVAA